MTHLQRIFLSLASVDLDQYREQIREVILRSGALPLFVEAAPVTDTNILQHHYDKVQAADVFVGIYGHGYGPVPSSDVAYRKADQTTAAGDNETSITHWEYLWALERGLPVLLFIIDPDEDSDLRADWPLEHIEDPADTARLSAFKHQLMNRHTVNFFSSPETLVHQVVAKLTDVLKSRLTAEQPFRGYELQEVIATGGYGMVYRAQQTAVDREVAIKRIRPEHTNQPDFIRSFEAEAKLIARLEHPYIVPLFDYWRDAESTCLVMRYMRGGSISQYIKGHPLPLDDVLRWMEQIGVALAYAHRHGVIHRDLKPDNLLLDEEGNAYLSDFGIARPAGHRSTDTSIVGTLAYMAPDQLKSEASTPQTDLYSFGIVLYELLTGMHPFAGQTPSQLILSHLVTPLPDITLMHPQLSPDIQTVIERATAKEPGQRYNDARAMVEAFRQAIHQGLAVSAALETVPDHIELTNPYKGLHAFQEYDVGDFFGRDGLITRFIERMRQAETGRLLAVIGPSGSGKSSVVKAGLLPSLRKGMLPGSESWFIAEMLPGSQPLEELEAALLRVAINPPANLLEQLKASEQGLVWAVNHILPPDDTELLLVIDQFEELFTLTNDEAQRVHFLNSLLAALDNPEARLRVVLTLRADFYDKPLYYLNFGTQLQKSVETVLPLSSTELEQAIVRPAEQTGAVLEKGLVAAILQEIGEQPGILPLLQYALTELFEHRKGHMLTFEAYRAMGGVTGALGQRAEALYTELDQTGQEAARQVFLRLITLGEGTEDTRRRVRQSEFGVLALPVIQHFGEARLLTFDRDPQTRGPTVEVAHEALLRTWQRLKDWITAVRDELSIHRRLSHATETWLGANQDSGFLAREAPLEQFESWSQTTTLSLNDMERAFLDASFAERTQRQTSDMVRRAHEAQTARRAQNLGRAAAVFAMTGLLAVVLTVIAFVRTDQLENINAAVDTKIVNSDSTLNAQATSAAVANITLTAQDNSVRDANAKGTQAALTLTAIKLEGEEQEEHLLSLSLVDAARRALISRDRPLAVHLALLAARRPGMKYPSNFAVEQAVHEIMYSSGLRKTIANTDVQIEVMAFNQERGLVALGLKSGTVEVRDALTGALKISVLAETPAMVTSLAFNQEGTKLAYGLYNNTLWLVNLDGRKPTPQELSPAAPTYNVYTIAFSPDGTSLVTSGDDAQVHLLDAATGAELSVQRAADPNDSTKQQGIIYTLAFSPDGKQVIAGGDGGDYALSLWHIENEGGDESKPTLIHDSFWRAPEGIRVVLGIAVYHDPDGTTKIATASIDKSDIVVRLWDLATGTPSERGVGHTDLIYSLGFSQDGKYLISGGADTSLRLWDVSTGTPRPIGDPWTGHLSSVTGVAFNADDKSVVSTSLDRTMRLWDVTIPQLEGTLWHSPNSSSVVTVVTSPDGKYIAAGAEEGTIQLLDTFSGEMIDSIHLPWSAYSLAFSPLKTQQGLTLAIGLANGQVYLWNRQGSASTLTLLTNKKHPIQDMAYSSDGRYLVIGSGFITDIEGFVQVWDMATNKLQTDITTKLNVRAVAISPAGACPGSTTCVAAGIQDGMIYVWNLMTGEPLPTFSRKHADAVLDLVFTPLGKCAVSNTSLGTCLISASADRTANIWDILSGHLVGAALVGHTHYVMGLAVSPDGKYVITSSEDGTLRLWDASTHAPIGQPWVGHTSGINAIALSPDGQHVVSGSKDGTLRLWAVRTLPQMIDWACKNRYASYLSPSELATYKVQEDISPSTCPAIESHPSAQLESGLAEP